MVLIIGAGAVGTVLAAHLIAARRDVKLLVREKNRSRYEPVNQVQVDRAGGGEALVVPRPALVTGMDLQGVDYLFICVKYPDLDPVLNDLPTPLPPGLTIVSTLNGISASRRIRERFPATPVVTMTVMYNAQLPAPLHAVITTKAEVLIGTEDQRLLQLFEGSGMSVVQARGDEAAWGKLLINLANAICALTHTTFKDLLTQSHLRRIYVGVLDEAVGLMQAAGIAFRLPMPMPYWLYRALLLGGGPLPWWFAKTRNRLKDGAFPSMVSDIEAGRATEVAQLNGEIVRLGASLGRPTPVNATIVELVRQREGHLPPSYLTPAELRVRLGL